MVKILVGMSMPIVHHVTITCLESLLISISKGTVAIKVPSLAALSALLLFLGVIHYLPTCLDPFCIFLPVDGDKGLLALWLSVP